MASRLWKHLLRAKSKAENIGLFALYSSFFLSVACLPHCQLLAIIEKTVLTHPMLIAAFGLSFLVPELDWKGLGFYI